MRIKLEGDSSLEEDSPRWLSSCLTCGFKGFRMLGLGVCSLEFRVSGSGLKFRVQYLVRCFGVQDLACVETSKTSDPFHPSLPYSPDSETEDKCLVRKLMQNNI